jgi:hypothetical protein
MSFPRSWRLTALQVGAVLTAVGLELVRRQSLPTAKVADPPPAVPLLPIQSPIYKAAFNVPGLYRARSGETAHVVYSRLADVPKPLVGYLTKSGRTVSWSLEGRIDLSGERVDGADLVQWLRPVSRWP